MICLEEPGCVTKEGPRGVAVFSADGLHRYWLMRRVGLGERTVAFVMMNASYADHEQDDMTVRKVMGFSRRLGYDRVYVVNLGGLVSKDPAKLLEVSDPVGPHNDTFLRRALYGAESAIVAWGQLPEPVWERFKPSVETVRRFKGLRCLGRTSGGAPRHPSRLGYAVTLEPWP